MIQSARWLDALDSPDALLRAALVRRAMADIGIEETARNSSPYIDEVLTQAGAQPGDPWCAALLTRWCRDTNIARPVSGAASCEVWHQFAIKRGTWREVGTGYVVLPGDIVLYGDTTHVHHCGLVARVSSFGMRDVEGNTSWSGFSREGVACDYKPVALSLVAGHIVPVSA